MRKIYVLLVFLQLYYPSFAQKSDLPVDESGKYTFYEVVELQAFDKDALMHNAEDFLKYYVNKKYKKEIVKDAEAGELRARSGFLVYKKGSLGKNVDGSIEYSIQIEVKDNKYRYIVSDFIFQEYERNRYGKFEPVKGKVKALEEPSSDLNKWQWDEHRETVKEKMDVFVGELKLAMLKTGQKEEKIKVKEDW